MNFKKVVIRLDGDSDIGLGHIYRGLALADILKRKFSVEFVIRKSTTISPIKESGFDYTFIPATIISVDEPNWFKEKYATDCIIVLDGYQFNEIYQKKIKEFNYKLVYIDDLTQGKQVADLVINHSPEVKKSDYKIEDYTKLALGLNYALLRQSYIKYDRTTVNLKREIKNVFISFGGADSNDFSFKAVKELIEIDSIKTMNVVLGVAYKANAIFELNSSKLKIHKSLSEHEIFELMKSSDLAIVPASTTSIELASLGVPMVLGYFVDNQKNIYRGFVEKQAVTGIGDYNSFNFSKLNNIIKSLGNSEKLNKQCLQLLSFFNDSMENNILTKFHFDEILIRKVSEFDMKFVFDLSNETLVRLNSFNPDEIEFEQHKQWFHSQLKNDKVLFYIIEINNVKMAQVRFSIKEKYAIIGISIVNDFRGKGLALKIIQKAVKEYFKKNNLPIHAYIKQINLASVKSFEKAGFYCFKEEVIKNSVSYIYKKEDNENR